MNVRPVRTTVLTGVATGLALLLAPHQLGGRGSRPAASRDPGAPIPVTLNLSSAVFEDGGLIPPEHDYSMGSQCRGKNISPELAWSGVPEGAACLALTVVDPDGGDWVHWLLYDIPADLAELPAAVGGPDIGVAGMTTYRRVGYGGPCPPSGTHRYVFTLYALDAPTCLPPGATFGEFTTAIAGHVLGIGTLAGLRAARR